MRGGNSPRESAPPLSNGRSGGGPEVGEGGAGGGLAELLEGALADLADALAGDAHEGPDLLERHRLGALVEAVVEGEDLPLAGGEVLAEDAVDVFLFFLVLGG